MTIGDVFCDMTASYPRNGAASKIIVELVKVTTFHKFFVLET